MALNFMAYKVILAIKINDRVWRAVRSIMEANASKVLHDLSFGFQNPVLIWKLLQHFRIKNK